MGVEVGKGSGPGTRWPSGGVVVDHHGPRPTARRRARDPQNANGGRNHRTSEVWKPLGCQPWGSRPTATRVRAAPVESSPASGGGVARPGAGPRHSKPEAPGRAAPSPRFSLGHADRAAPGRANGPAHAVAGQDRDVREPTARPLGADTSAVGWSCGGLVGPDENEPHARDPRTKPVSPTAPAGVVLRP